MDFFLFVLVNHATAFIFTENMAIYWLFESGTFMFYYLHSIFYKHMEFSVKVFVLENVLEQNHQSLYVLKICSFFTLLVNIT